MSQLPQGIPAPDFELQTVDGRSRRLTDALRSGPVALVFYKASCPTCQYTFPFIQKIFSDPRRKTPTIWGISQDEADETRQFAEQDGITFDLLIDEHPYRVSSAYGVEFVPAIFIVEPEGRVTLSDFGFSKSSLNRIAGFEVFAADDGIPSTRPG